MFIDALLEVSNAQAFGAGAVSTSSIDLGVPGGLAPAGGTKVNRQIGTGEPLGFGIGITTAGTVADSVVDIISTTDAALTAGLIVHATYTIKLAAALLGALFFAPLPQGTPTQRFLGIRITTAGGTISATAWLTTHSMFSLVPVSYAKAYLVD
ncbi:MAG TPA: hypothetical protein VKR23_15920 [Gaiellaceae bacterium]|nr:hypothetical protein [Gaiellaceae bacterium]